MSALVPSRRALSRWVPLDLRCPGVLRWVQSLRPDVVGIVWHDGYPTATAVDSVGTPIYRLVLRHGRVLAFRVARAPAGPVRHRQQGASP